MSCSEAIDSLYYMANKRERAIYYSQPMTKGWIDEVRTYEAWCKSCNGKHFIRCSFGDGNPYIKFEEARLSMIIPLIAKGLLAPNQPTKADKENDNEDNLFKLRN